MYPYGPIEPELRESLNKFGSQFLIGSQALTKCNHDMIEDAKVIAGIHPELSSSPDLRRAQTQTCLFKVALRVCFGGNSKQYLERKMAGLLHTLGYAEPDILKTGVFDSELKINPTRLENLQSGSEEDLKILNGILDWNRDLSAQAFSDLKKFAENNQIDYKALAHAPMKHARELEVNNLRDFFKVCVDLLGSPELRVHIEQNEQSVMYTHPNPPIKKKFNAYNQRMIFQLRERVSPPNSKAHESTAYIGAFPDKCYESLEGDHKVPNAKTPEEWAKVRHKDKQRAQKEIKEANREFTKHLFTYNCYENGRKVTCSPYGPIGYGL